ncbi:MAG TPA: AAA family ATPase [Rhodothermales bacterium]
MHRQSPTTIRLTDHQSHALDALLAFLDGQPGAFVLTGSAGTGKTTLLKALCEELEDTERRFQLLAPTGRAARVLQRRTGFSARTAHSHLYTPEPLEKRPGVRLIRKSELGEETDVIVVDEASMVAAAVAADNTFVVANALLDDLFDEARRHAAHLVFVGDPCQLPPVGEVSSRALDPAFLRDRYGCRTDSAHLHEVLRQSAGSDVLEAATALRDRMEGDEFAEFALPRMSTRESIAAVADAVTEGDFSRSVLLAYTNRSVFRMNAAVRRRLGRGSGLEPGDLVVTERDGWADGRLVPRAELFVVDFVEPRPEFAGLRFAQVTLAPVASDLPPVEGLALLDTLDDERGAITPEQEHALWARAIDDNATFKGSKRPSDDPYVGALRLRYGYALTVHKAQGGEWSDVYFDPFVPRVVDPDQRLRWFYTAITRASESCRVIAQ